MADKIAALTQLIQPIVEAEGYMFWGLNFHVNGKHSCLKVFIENEKGISLDDCSLVSRQLSAVLDVENPIPSRYNLEVSSPGMARQLFTPAQYRQFAGEKLDIVLMVAIEGRKRFTGILTSVVDEGIFIETDGHSVRLPFNNIAKAKIVPAF